MNKEFLLLLAIIFSGCGELHWFRGETIRIFHKDMMTSLKQDNVERVRGLLEENKQWVNTRLDMGNIPLVTVCDSLPELKSFIRHGVDLNLEDKTGRTPIFQWCYLGKVPMVRYALSHGADPTHRSDHGRTVWHSAADSKNPDIIPFLAKRVPELINVADPESGTTPLHIAASKNLPRHTKLLIRYGAEVNAQDYLYERTPLHEALQMEAIKAAKVLLTSGECDLSITDKHGNKALDMARRRELKGIIKLLNKISQQKK